MLPIGNDHSDSGDSCPGGSLRDEVVFGFYISKRWKPLIKARKPWILSIK